MNNIFSLKEIGIFHVTLIIGIISNFFMYIFYNKIAIYLKNNDPLNYKKLKELKISYPRYQKSKLHKYIVSEKENLPKGIVNWISIYHYSYIIYKMVLYIIVLILIIILILAFLR